MMVTRLRFVIQIGIVVSAGLSRALPSAAWEIQTHRAISQEAVETSSVNQVLHLSLGMEQGIRTVLDGREIREWLAIGSEREDDFTIFPFGRFLHHFHHPLRPWDRAGLSDGFSGTSSAIWAQTREQSALGTGSWSWQETRDRFHLALRSEKKGDRDKFLAQTFQGLGHQVHLIQDAAAVPHARNEAHPPPHFNLEKWTRDRFQTRRPTDFARLLQQTPRVLLDPELLRESPNPLAPIPISKFIDADRYTGENPDATSVLRDGLDAGGQPTKLAPVGLAEYTNANFAHRNTIFTDTLPQTHKWWSPYPRRSSTNLAALGLPEEVTAEDGQVDRTIYIRKERDGERIEHFLKASYVATFTDELGRPTNFRLQFTLDDRVYEDYVRLLLPRAVGYSIGLLDYFFRGTLDFTIGGSSTNQTLTITNKSTEVMDGTFTLYADNFSDIRGLVGGASFNLNLGPEATSGALSFTAPTEVQAYTLVFQGKLGLEEGAVTGKVNEWYAVTDVTPGSITPGQPTTITITIKSSFRRQQQTLVAALFDGNAVTLAATSAVIPNSGPATTNLSLEVTPTTIPSSAPGPISLVVASDADIATITPADLSNQVTGDPMTLVRVGQASRLPIYQRVVSGCQAKIRSVAFASDAKSSGTPTLTINAPANLQDGDILLGHVFFRITSGIPVITDPSGFMVVGFNYGEPNIRMNASSKVALGEGGFFTWTATNASGNHWIAFGALIAISGANTSDYEDIDVDDQSSLWSDITPTVTNTTIIRTGIASNAATPFTITGPSAPYKELYNEILTLPGGSPWFGASYRWFGYSMGSNAAEANSASVEADPSASGRHGYSVAVIPGTCR